MEYKELKQKFIEMRAIIGEIDNIDIETVKDYQFGIRGYKDFEVIITDPSDGNFLLIQRVKEKKICELYMYSYQHMMDLSVPNSPVFNVPLSIISPEDRDGIVNQVLQDYAEILALKSKAK